MRKLLSLLLFVVFFLNAGNVSSQAVYEKGTILINGGIGIGYFYGNGGIPVVVSGEYAVTDAISVGPYIGYTSRTYSSYSWKYRYTFIDFGVRGAYHYAKHLNLNMDQLDLYGGLFIGYIAANSKVLDSPNDINVLYPGTASYASVFRAGLFAGARYYFTDQIAAYLEVGYGIAPLSLGATFKI